MQSVPTGIPAARSVRRPIEGRDVRGGPDRGSSPRPVVEVVAGPPADPPGPPGRPPARRPADPARDEERGLATKQRPKADRPPRFKVLLFNDDYTPMEFVVQVLEQIFGKSPSAATQIMLQIHRSGIGVAGVYVLEIAETKSTMVHRMAEERGYPLRSGVEKE